MERAMDEVDIFREAADYGGRLDTTSLEPATAVGFDYVAQMPPIHFDFVDSWKFNGR